MTKDKQARTNVRTELRRYVAQIPTKPEAVLVQENTLQMPSIISVPESPKIGSQFNSEFVVFDFAGTAVEHIGTYRKKKYGLWRVKCTDCQVTHTVRLPIAGGLIAQAKINTQCDLCCAPSTSVNNNSEAQLVWSDENLKLAGGYRRRF